MKISFWNVHVFFQFIENEVHDTRTKVFGASRRWSWDGGSTLSPTWTDAHEIQHRKSSWT